MNHDTYNIPDRAVLLATLGLMAILLLTTRPVLAQDEVPSEPAAASDSETPAPGEASPVPPAQRALYEQKLREWEQEQESLHGELMAAVESSDQIETYYILKRLHGGGAGVDGSEFELRTAEIRERRKQLEERKEELRRMQVFSKSAQDYPQLRADFQENLKILEARVAKQQQTIAKLEREALEFAERSIVKELPIIFTLLSGGRLNEPDDPRATETNNRRR